jgi:hypothetical protein
MVREKLSNEELALAKEALEEAKELLKDGYLRGSINRAYYASFHAAKSLLVLLGYEPKKHSGAISLFGKEIVKKGLIQSKYGRILSELFEWRKDADYGPLRIDLTRKRVEELVKNAGDFLDEIEKLRTRIKKGSSQRSSSKEAQIIITIGFILAIALVFITIMLSDIIYVGNTASLESLNPPKIEIYQFISLVNEEVEFARARYAGDPDKGEANFTKYMNNFSRGVEKLYAASGKGVEIDTSGIMFGEGVISSDDSIAWCGKGKHIKNWMDSLGRSYTSFGDKCDELIDNLCSDPPTCTSPNFDVAIFENPDIKYENFSGGDCRYIESDDINETQCGTLQNWTYKGGIYIQTEGEKRECDASGSTYNMIDVLRVPNVKCVKTNGKSEDDEGYVKKVSPLLKNVQEGDRIEFKHKGLVLKVEPSLTRYVNSTKDGTDEGGLIVNWTNGSGEVYYFPTIHLKVKRLLGVKWETIIKDKEESRIFNLFEPGGECRIKVKFSDGRTKHEAIINC